MPFVDFRTDRGRAWPNRDRLEGYVRYCLLNNPGIFRNHSFQRLPRMVVTIPGQYDSQRGIDVIAIDAHDKVAFDEDVEEQPRRRLWLIEISRGRRRGGALSKELLERQYAGNQAQMSLKWRRAAADKFLGTADVTDKLAVLFDVGKPDDYRAGKGVSGFNRKELVDLFEIYFESHMAAIVVPKGCHVAGGVTDPFYHSLETDPFDPQLAGGSTEKARELRFEKDIYTFNWRFAR